MGAYEYCGDGPLEPPTSFSRGDASSDASVDIADAIFLLNYFFRGGEAPACRDAADANDDGRENIADVLSILQHLFAETGPLPEPFGHCGIDPTTDALDCSSYPHCQ